MGYFSIKELEFQELAEGVNIQVIPGERMTMVVFSLKNWRADSRAFPSPWAGGGGDGRDGENDNQWLFYWIKLPD